MSRVWDDSLKEWVEPKAVYDKDGKEILEGDVVRLPDGRVGAVCWMIYFAASRPLHLEVLK